MALAGIASSQPELNEHEVRNELLRRLYGPAVAAEVRDRLVWQ